MRTVPRERMSLSMPASDGTAEPATNASAASAVRMRFMFTPPGLSDISSCPKLGPGHALLPEPVADLAADPEIDDLVIALGIDGMDDHPAAKSFLQLGQFLDRELHGIAERTGELHGQHDRARSGAAHGHLAGM